MNKIKVEESFLRELIQAYGASGHEEDVRAIIAEKMKSLVDEITVDKFGNLVCRKKGKKPTILLMAHLDEIGIMVKSITEKGAIYLSPLGGIEPSILIGQRVVLKTKKGAIHGVISSEELAAGDFVTKLPAINEIFVDTGYDAAQLTKMGVSPGDFVILEGDPCPKCEPIIIGKALDDRIGCFILVELAKRLKKNKNEIYYVFSAQEEVGLYGAVTSLFKIDAAWGIAVDVGGENFHSLNPTKIMGKGPTITAKDAEMIGNRCINNWLKHIAERHKIPYQIEVSDEGTTDAMPISTSKGGIPVTVVGVPIRNIHSTMSMAHMNDVKHAIMLLEHLLKKPPMQCIV